MSVKKNVVIQEDVLNVSQVANKLGLTERTILDKLRSGELKGSKKFKTWFVKQSDLIDSIFESEKKD